MQHDNFESLVTHISTQFIKFSADAIDELIVAALKELGAFAQVDRSYVFQFSQDLTVMSNTHEWCAAGIQAERHGLQNVPMEQLPFFSEIIRRREVFHVPSVAELDAAEVPEKNEFERQQIKSLICVPMILEDALVGFVGFDSVREEKTWSDKHIALLKIVGEIFVNALERKKAQGQIQHQNRFLENVIESLTHPFLVVNADDYTVALANSAAGVPSGYHGQKCYELRRDRSEPCESDTRPCLVREVQAKRGPVRFEVEGAGEKQGRMYAYHGYPILDADGNVRQVIEYSLDITERKQAEAALQENEELLRTIFEAAQEAIIAINDQGLVTLFNPAAEKMFGRSYLEMAGHHLNCLMPEEYRENHNRFVRSYFQTGSPSEAIGRLMELPGLRSDGTTFPMEISLSACRRGADQLVIAVARDITARKATEEALRQSEIRNRTVLQTAVDAVITVDTEGTIETVNPAVEKLFGYTSRELIGNNVKILMPEPHQSRHDEYIKRYLETGVPRVIGTGREVLARRKDGSTFPAELSVAEMQVGDRRLLTGVIRNITQRKRAEAALRDSEEKFREIAEMMPVGLFETDAAGVITFANKKAFEYSGYRHDDLKRGITALELIVPNDRDRIQRNFYRVLAGERLGPNDYTALRKDGSTFPVTVHSGCILKDGKPAGLRGVVVNITDRTKLEMERLKAEKLESVGILAGGLAHDFNNLLTGIMGNISLARHEVSQETQIERWLEEAEQAAIEAKSLTQQLLTFSKGGEPVKEVTEVDRLLRDAVSFALRGSNVKSQFLLEEPVRPVEIDTGQIRQVIHNLVVNADQAMPEGGTIRIGADNETIPSRDSRPLSPGEYVVISIKDEGTGIPQKYLPKIFDPYFTTKQSGSGLGLATAYSIIQKHNGFIEVESQVGEGTHIRVYLPACGESKITDDKKPNTVPSGTGRVLVMDDEEFIRELAGQVLERFGYEVDCAEDGTVAIDLFRAAQEAGTPYRAVILDLTIPGGMGGKETIRALRKLDPQIKAVVSSGYSNDPVMANYAQNGFDSVVPKPYRPSELGQVIHELLTSSKPVPT